MRRCFKGFVPDYHSYEFVKENLRLYPPKGENAKRDIVIIQEVLLSGTSTEQVAGRVGISSRRVQQVVGRWLQHVGYTRGVKPQSAPAQAYRGLDREAVYQAHNNMCTRCGFTVPALRGGGNVVHHIVPVKQGGSHELF